MRKVLWQLLGIVALFSFGGVCLLVGITEMLMWAIPTDTAWIDVIILLVLGVMAFAVGVISYYKLDQIVIMEVEYDTKNNTQGEL